MGGRPRRQLRLAQGLAVQVLLRVHGHHNLPQLAREAERSGIVRHRATPVAADVEAIKRLLAHQPQLRILALSAHEDTSHSRRALQAGALGYLSKRSAPEALIDALRSIARGARLAVDVIQFDPSIERAIHHACGNALVCDTMDIARSVVYDRKVEAKAVTLEGTVIHKSGLITGGQSSSSGGKRWEEREVQGLTTQRDKCLAELKELTQKLIDAGRVKL